MNEESAKGMGTVDVENSVLKIITFIALIFNLWTNSFQFAFLSKDEGYKTVLLVTVVMSWLTDVIFGVIGSEHYYL